MAFDHHYILEKVDAGTKAIQKEEYTGFTSTSGIAWVEPAYQRVNEALRTEVLSRKKGISEGKSETDKKQLTNHFSLLFGSQNLLLLSAYVRHRAKNVRLIT